MTDEQIELKRQVERWEKEIVVSVDMSLNTAISLANRLIIALGRIELLEGKRSK